MRKSLLLSAMMLFATCELLASSNQELMKFIPSSSNLIVAADISKMLEMPFVKDARQRDPELERQFQELEGKLAARKLSIQDTFSNFVVFADEQNKFAGVLVSTKMGDENLEALLKGEIFSSPPSDYSVETIAGRKTYVLKGPKPSIPGQDALPQQLGGKKLDELMGANASKTLALTFLDKETLLVIGMESYDKYLAAKAFGLNQPTRERLSSINMASPVWGVFALPPKMQQAGNMAPNTFYDKVVGGAISLNAKAMPKDDIAVHASLECLDTPAAAMTAFQLQQIVLAMTFASAKNPDSAMPEILSSVTLDNKDRFVSIDLSLGKKALNSLNGRGGQQPSPKAP